MLCKVWTLIFVNKSKIGGENTISSIDKALIHEKQKVDGHYRHTIEIVYNFVGAVEDPNFD